MARESSRAEQLDAILTAEAPALAAAIESAPPWRKTWPKAAARAFRRQLHIAEPIQDTPPNFTD